MKIMSFNILCYGKEGHEREKREPYVAEIINKISPDSLGVQEATPEWMSYLSENLPSYSYVGVGRDDGKNEGEYSAVFYKKDIYDVCDSGTFWLSDTPEKASLGWDGACKRVCTWAVLERKTDKAKFVHINTHLDHIGVLARKNGLKMILQKAEEFNSLPVVVTGDFNLDEGSDFYKDLTDNDILKDTKYNSSQTMNHFTYNGFDENPTQIIDYVFINDNFTSKEYKVITDKKGEIFISDHYPVTAELDF